MLLKMLNYNTKWRAMEMADSGDTTRCILKTCIYQSIREGKFFDVICRQMQ